VSKRKPKPKKIKFVDHQDPLYIARTYGILSKFSIDNLDVIAPWFVALEVEVGPYSGLRHYGLISDAQYINFTGYPIEHVLKHTSRYANELFRWWKEIEYPFITDSGYRLAVKRIKALCKHVSPAKQSSSIVRGGIDRELVRAIRWVQAKLPGGDPELARAIDSIRPYEKKRVDGSSRHTSCVTGSRIHVDGSCFLCAVPAPWSYVSFRHPSSAPFISGRIG